MNDTLHLNQVDYSIVIPVYFNEGCLTQTMTALVKDVISQNSAYSPEVIFVDDGSGDGSLKELLQIRETYPDIVRVIKLSRNFGQVNALLAGFANARGGCVVAMSADGQDPASLINDMLKGHFQEGFEVVLCTRIGRDESIYRTITSRIFYSLIKKLTFPNMPEGGFDFVLMGEKALKIFLQNIDTAPFFQGQILWMGLTTKYIEYQRNKRTAGISRWTFAKKITYLIDGVLAYSFAPVRFISLLGILLSLLGFFYAVIVFFNKILLGNPVRGWTPLMIVVLVLGGFQMLMLGILGEYQWRVLAQVRNRAMYVIEAVYDTRKEKNQTS